AILNKFGPEIDSLENQKPRLVMKSRKVSRNENIRGRKAKRKEENPNKGGRKFARG
ncbi:hypothetical protein A2U01_0025201, partial [Trifolium medium]|nr:hypothetical protein [Trifolium medium]